MHFIDHEKINSILAETRCVTDEDLKAVLKKAEKKEGLSYRDIAILLQAEKAEHLERLQSLASQMKQRIYGNRVVLFAPLYVSNHCVNTCTYCGYQQGNSFLRRKLNEEELREEVRILEKMGHKRIALEAGEDPKNCDIDYIVNALKIIYDEATENSHIRRANVNIAATTVENYGKLKAADIGTYILFQETYHQPTYESVHTKGPKANYAYHLTAFDRAMEAGIDDVGAGVLFGLYDYRFEVLALMMHNNHLEKEYGVGFHTISVPRLKQAEGMRLEDYPHLVSDEEFIKLVSILRLAVPFTGIILSTREKQETRTKLLSHGVSQISAGSCTGVGGYKAHEKAQEIKQFEIADERSPLEIIKDLIKDGFIPSYCTSCYRMGRTGDRFMALAKSGQIQNVCQPNAMMTLKEYAMDFGDDELKELVDEMLRSEITKIPTDGIKKLVKEGLQRLEEGERDIYV